MYDDVWLYSCMAPYAVYGYIIVYEVHGMSVGILII